MNTLIQLLKQKNQCLKQFEKISSLSLNRLRRGDISHIQYFYHNRQFILQNIDHIDEQLKKMKFNPLSPKDKKTMQKLIQEKKAITLNVLKKDLLIHSYLNDGQHEATKEDRIA